MEKRRQNHSCEQCRKSKKACDGYVVNSTRAQDMDAAFDRGSPESKLLPCSYCVKTRKECTLNPHWARPQQPEVGDAPFPVVDGTCSPEESGHQAKRQKVEFPEPNTDALGPTALGTHDCGLMRWVQAPPHPPHPLGWDVTLPISNGPPASSTNDPLAAMAMDSAASNHQVNALPGNWDFMLSTNSTSGAPAHHTNLGYFADPTMTEYGSNQSSLDAQSNMWDFRPAYPAPRGSTSSVTSPSRREPNMRKDGWSYREEDSEERRRKYSTSMSLSPFAVDHITMAKSNSNLITDSLLRIYHDVLENNLACWLAEDTCPYKMQQRKDQLIEIQRRPSSVGGPASSLHEWGPAWSNRMYRRVKQLDRVAQSAKLIRLTRSENQAASKALDLAIMAFATQWAQGDRRREKFDPAVGDDLDQDISDGEFGYAFERNLQQSFWEQAKRALQDVADLECYRVVYAELIFGLTQKPWACHDDLEVEPFGPDPSGGRQSVQSSIIPRVMEILEDGGPPVVLERAARRINTLKCRLETSEAGLQGKDQISRTYSKAMIGRVGAEERYTVGLLYWLAVMFDTVSSSMNERPVVVSDQECQHEEAQEAERDSARRSASSLRWELDLYAQDNSKEPAPPLHWPCPYEDATRALSRSAAVKVLLWRYVSYLQNALRKNQHGETIEELIQATTWVYRYWNKTHGSFFRDLIRNYNSIPARIKSWFPAIGIPWHLGSLMLADLLDFVDENGYGLEEGCADRLNNNMAMRIRRSSATELADLASIATPQEIGDMPPEQLPDFHFAVNESPLLTEPWTVLLIRAFTKASLFHLNTIEDLRRHEWPVLAHESEDLQSSIRRGERCIKTLWFLGSKSEMARSLAKVLAKGLYMQESEQMLVPVINQGITV